MENRTRNAALEAFSLGIVSGLAVAVFSKKENRDKVVSQLDKIITEGRRFVNDFMEKTNQAVDNPKQLQKTVKQSAA